MSVGSRSQCRRPGPEDCVSPNGYATKRIDGKVVPTWNDEGVHVRGSIRA
ncbi:MAG: FMN-binding negative transcriptional regulator [Myxococcota bacterium]